MSSINYRISQLDDVKRVHDFEVKLKFSSDPESIETQMQVWDSAFRIEALEHYFKLGWSFLALNEKNEIVGFFMGQPLLFIDKQTQTLWVEHVSAINDEIATELLDIAYRLAREKHFQRVLVSEEVQNFKLTKNLPFQKWSRQNLTLKTTK